MLGEGIVLTVMMIELLSLSLVSFASRPQDSKGDAHGLIEKLRSDTPEVREEASRGLKSLGRGALGELEVAAKDPDREVSGRARHLIKIIGITEKLTPRLLKEMPGLEERIASRGEPVWTEAFLDAVREMDGTYRHPSLRIEDLDALTVNAIRGAESSELRMKVSEACGQWAVRSAIPDMIRLLSHEDPQVRGSVASDLENLGAREAIPELRKLLHSAPVQSPALWALGVLGAKEALPEILPFLKRDPGGSDHASWAVGDLGATEAIPDLLKVLYHRNPQARSMAARALGCLRAKEAVPEFIKLLADPEEGIRSQVAWVLGVMGAREAIPDLRRLLKDDYAWARGNAAEALAALGVKEAIPEILNLLKDKEEVVRLSAAQGLADLGSKEGGDVLLLLLKSPDTEIGLQAACALCERGSRAGLPLLLEQASGGRKYRLYSLNALRNRDAWKHLKTAPPPPYVAGTAREALLHLSKDAGMSLEWPSQPPALDNPTWLLERQLATDRMRCMGLTLGDRFSAELGISFEMVLDPGRIRILSRPEAIRFWTHWAEETGK
jgi:HEAT repeat protein